MLFVQQHQHHLPAPKSQSLNTDHAESTNGLGESTARHKHAGEAEEEVRNCLAFLGLGSLCYPKIFIFTNTIVLPENYLVFLSPNCTAKCIPNPVIQDHPSGVVRQQQKCDAILQGSWFNTLGLLPIGSKKL